jgi:hypothetical protein
VCQGLSCAAKDQDQGGGEPRGAEAGMERGQVSEKAGQQKEHDQDADRSAAEHGNKQRRGESSGGRTDGAVERRFPRCADGGLGDDECSDDRPVALRKVKSRIDGIGDGARKSGLDSLLQRSRFAGPEGRRGGNRSLGQWQRRICRGHAGII